MASIVERVRRAVNVFRSADADPVEYREDFQYGGYSGFGARPDRSTLRMINDRSLMSSILTRLSIDVASVPLEHVKVDENDRYTETVKSELNHCLTVEANIDQPARQFRQDIALSLFDKGYIAIVPIDTTENPARTQSYDIYTMRVGEIVNTYPYHVRVSIWNEKLGRREEIIVSKTVAAIVENPFYQVMNEPNGTLQRLLRKLAMLDRLDEKTSSGKLDLIMQLPYVIKTDAKREQAEQRRASIEEQLNGATHGIAYTDGTEKITQLNRPVENTMLTQIQDLTAQLYSQLGLSSSIFDGTADEATMLNYRNRTIEPIVAAIQESMERTFITRTARTQGQRILYMIDPFKLMPISQVAEMGDKFTRNEILSSNEFRGIIGYKPVADPNADKLRNSNVPQAADGGPLAIEAPASGPTADDLDGIMNEVFDGLEKDIDGIVGTPQS